MTLKKLIKKNVPSSLWGWLHRKRGKVLHRGDIEEYQRHYVQIVKRLQVQKEPINVLFIAIYSSNWKYDSVYQMMLKTPIFNPLILVCPDVCRGREHMLETMNNCCSTFKQKGYSYIKAYDENTDSYVDAHAYQPDIIFYTNPYNWLIDNRYYLDKFPNSLICYINYAYNNHNQEFGFNLPFHQQLWRYFVECEDNRDLVSLFSPIDGKNSVVVGYPMYDLFAQGTSIGYDWKCKNKKHKRIIWAPHHTISNQNQLLQFSTFELFYDIMWKLAVKYKDKIQIVFKPHPLLKDALYRLEGWGKERTDKYYQMWENGENTSYVNGEYIDLFNSSDAMINDSGSFTIEYLYMNKPCLLLNNFNRQEEANKVTLKALSCWYKATNAEQIEDFIVNVVIAEHDNKVRLREDFYNKVLLPPNSCTVAENIINDIKNELLKK